MTVCPYPLCPTDISPKYDNVKSVCGFKLPVVGFEGIRVLREEDGKDGFRRLALSEVEMMK